MGDPICKWRAAKTYNVVELVNNILPHEQMLDSDFYKVVDERMPGFMHTPYQLACQLGLYVVYDGIYYPRFTKDITDEEAKKYLETVVSKYYVPNPYTKRGFKNLTKPILLEKSIVEYLEKHPQQDNLEQILSFLIKEEVGNFSAIKTLLSYSKLFTIIGSRISLNPNYKDMEINNDRNDKKAFFEIFSQQLGKAEINAPFQQIFYGAPGTGKSHKIKERLQGVPTENIFRTTFHPDSDYSTFVGAYKPTMKRQYRYEGKVKATYYEDDDLAGSKKGEPVIEKVIEYSFVPQAFLNAYIRAYQTDENVYLIIEEINRGNCAQIFGDLFQLLDRDANGVSEYAIKADADLRAFVEEALGADSPGIKDGELSLPSNLYIWATMNTSDQSLFPIDSAFKRRWDWEYEPISYKNAGWRIAIGGNEYSWTSFQREVNKRIFDATHSEDKMLGDYFVNPADGVISADLLRNKVLFYLWNDVCKDGEGDIFRTSETDEIQFSDLYGQDGSRKLLAMMDYLHVETFGKSLPDDELEYGEDESGSFRKYTLNGTPILKTDIAKAVFEEYARKNPNLSVEEVLRKWENVKNEANSNRNRATTLAIKHLIVDAAGFNNYVEQSKNKERAEKRWTKVGYRGNDLYVWNNWGDKTDRNLGNIESFVNEVGKHWGIKIVGI